MLPIVYGCELEHASLCALLSLDMHTFVMCDVPICDGKELETKCFETPPPIFSVLGDTLLIRLHLRG